MLYSDFMREYRMDLLTVWNTLPWWRFMALIRGLSGESSFIQAITPDEEGEGRRATPSAPAKDLSDASEEQVRAHLSNIVPEYRRKGSDTL